MDLYNLTCGSNTILVVFSDEELIAGLIWLSFADGSFNSNTIFQEQLKGSAASQSIHLRPVQPDGAGEVIGFNVEDTVFQFFNFTGQSVPILQDYEVASLLRFQSARSRNEQEK